MTTWNSSREVVEVSDNYVTRWQPAKHVQLTLEGGRQLLCDIDEIRENPERFEKPSEVL